jgi:hypothetical protein
VIFRKEGTHADRAQTTERDKFAFYDAAGDETVRDYNRDEFVEMRRPMMAKSAKSHAGRRDERAAPTQSLGSCRSTIELRPQTIDYVLEL